MAVGAVAGTPESAVVVRDVVDMLVGEHRSGPLYYRCPLLDFVAVNLLCALRVQWPRHHSDITTHHCIVRLRTPRSFRWADSHRLSGIMSAALVIAQRQWDGGTRTADVLQPIDARVADCG